MPPCQCVRAVLPCKGKRRIAAELPEVEKTQRAHWIVVTSPQFRRHFVCCIYIASPPSQAARATQAA